MIWGPVAGSATSITESGGTRLPLASVADGELLYRSGSTIDGLAQSSLAGTYDWFSYQGNRAKALLGLTAATFAWAADPFSIAAMWSWTGSTIAGDRHGGNLIPRGGSAFSYTTGTLINSTTKKWALAVRMGHTGAVPGAPNYLQVGFDNASGSAWAMLGFDIDANATKYAALLYDGVGSQTIASTINIDTGVHDFLMAWDGTNLHFGVDAETLIVTAAPARLIANTHMVGAILARSSINAACRVDSFAYGTEL
jgi:hypothetical protein